MCYLGLLLDYRTSRIGRNTTHERQCKKKINTENKTKYLLRFNLNCTYKCKSSTRYKFITENEQMAQIVNILLIYILVFIYFKIKRVIIQQWFSYWAKQFHIDTGFAININIPVGLTLNVTTDERLCLPKEYPSNASVRS